MTTLLDTQINDAVTALSNGGIIAYPTEYCFGLGCDPRNTQALSRLLAIKQRKKEQGVILVAGNIAQVSEYADLNDLPQIDRVYRSWPGPYTWVLPAKANVSDWVSGKHGSVAMRISAHPICESLCLAFGHAIVSTSANRHGSDALLSAAEVAKEFNSELDHIIDAPVGGAETASTILDAVSGEKLR